MNKDPLPISDIPQKFDVNIYTMAKKLLIEKYKKHSDVISIYSFGSLKHPGISDIDFIVVTKDNLKIKIDKKYSIYNLNSKIQKAIYHEPFILPIHLFKQFKQIFPLRNIKLEYGENIQLKSYDDINDKLLIAIYFINQFYPQVFENLLSGDLRVRFALQIISAFIHFLKLIEPFNCSIKYEDLEVLINDLRSNWFNSNFNDNIKNLKIILKQCVPLSKEINLQINDYIKKYLWHIQNNTKQILGVFNYYGIIFLANQIINKDLNNRINKDLFLKLGYKLNTVPAELIFPLIIYKEQCGPFSEFVKKNLETDLNIHDIKIKKPAIVEKIIKRAEFFNKHMEFYHKSISGIGMLHDYYKMVYRPLKKPKKSPAQNEAHFGYLKN